MYFNIDQKQSNTANAETSTGWHISECTEGTIAENQWLTGLYYKKGLHY